MVIRNESGEAADYDVEPSDPGPPNPAAQPLVFALTSSAVGAAFTGFGCLTGFGDQAFVLAGLGFLVVGLAFQAVAFDRARRFSRRGRTFLTAGTGRIHLDDGEERAHTFAPGNWVEFWSKKDPTRMLAQSPPVFDPTAKVVLRRCVDPAHLTAGARVPPSDMGYHVDIQ